MNTAGTFLQNFTVTFAGQAVLILCGVILLTAALEGLHRVWESIGRALRTNRIRHAYLRDMKPAPRHESLLRRRY